MLWIEWWTKIQDTWAQIPVLLMEIDWVGMGLVKSTPERFTLEALLGLLSISSNLMAHYTHTIPDDCENWSWSDSPSFAFPNCFNAAPNNIYQTNQRMCLSRKKICSVWLSAWCRLMHICSASAFWQHACYLDLWLTWIMFIGCPACVKHH